MGLSNNHAEEPAASISNDTREPEPDLMPKPLAKNPGAPPGSTSATTHPLLSDLTLHLAPAPAAAQAASLTLPTYSSLSPTYSPPTAADSRPPVTRRKAFKEGATHV
jgi:hypothetical protein